MPFGYSQLASWLREDDEFGRYNRPGSSDWFDLSGNVSFAKPNNRHDAFKVESLLGYGGYMDLERSGGPLGLTQGTLEKPIKAFQKKNGLKVDGLLKPGGPTITKMKELYGNAFDGSLAPTPAMVDANAEAIHAGEDGFLYDKGPPFALKPSRRLDGKAHMLEFERWNRENGRAARGDNPTSLVPEYETYIHDIDKEHGHDPGLIFARTLAKQIENFHGPENAGAFAKALVSRLSDRPDLQQAFLGREVPTSPPIGTFKPGGEARVKEWIDQDRIANGVAPRYAKSLSAQTPPHDGSPSTEPDPKNLLEYGRNFGAIEPTHRTQEPAGDEGAESLETRRSDDEVEDETPKNRNGRANVREIRSALSELNDKIEKSKEDARFHKKDVDRLTEEIQALESSGSDPLPKPETGRPRDPRRLPNAYLEAARLILKIAISVWRAYSEAEKRRKIDEGISERKSELFHAKKDLAATEAELDALEKELFRLHTRRIALKCDDSGPLDEK